MVHTTSKILIVATIALSVASSFAAPFNPPSSISTREENHFVARDDLSERALDFAELVTRGPEDIRAQRLALGLTQAEMAKRLGVSVATIIKWESGKSRRDTPVESREFDSFDELVTRGSEDIRAQRIALGLTQAEMAKRLGVSVATIIKWESGKSRRDTLVESREFDEFDELVTRGPEDIRAQRLALGLTQAEMAKHLGVSVATIIKWESGKSRRDTPVESREFDGFDELVTRGPEDIRAQRLALGLTQAEMARRMGVTVATIQKWESGKSRRDIPVESREFDGFDELVTRNIRAERLALIHDAAEQRIGVHY